MHSTTTTLGVTGMTCGNCVSHVTNDLREVPGVENVSVQLRVEGVSEVTVFSAAPLDEAAVREAIDEAGYEIASYEVKEDAQAAAFTEQSGEMRKAHNCNCGCGGTGGGAGPTYRRDMGTYSLTVPPRA